MKSGYGTAELILIRLTAIKAMSDTAAACDQLLLLEDEAEQPFSEKTPEQSATHEAIRKLLLEQQRNGCAPAALWEDAMSKTRVWRDSMR